MGNEKVLTSLSEKLVLEGINWNWQLIKTGAGLKCSCTDSLPTLGDRKKWISGACQWMDFLDSKEILHHFINGIYFYERQIYFHFLLCSSCTLLFKTMLQMIID